MSTGDLTALNVAILTVSDSRDKSSDLSGDYLAQQVKAAGHNCVARDIVTDDIYQVRAVVATWCAQREARVILVTGGTGLTGRDSTPEAVQVLFDKEIEGFGEMFRVLSMAEIGASTIQSRAVAGLSNCCFIFVLPGSPGACRLGWEKLIAPQLDNRTRPCNLNDLVPRLDEHKAG